MKRIEVKAITRTTVVVEPGDTFFIPENQLDRFRGYVELVEKPEKAEKKEAKPKTTKAKKED